MTNRALFLRPASLADLNALVALEKACFAAIDAFQRPALRRLLLSSNTVIVAEDRSGPSPDLIGESIILFRATSRIARIYSICVAPAASGRGVARALLEASMANARERGCDRLRLEVRKSNIKAIGLYESMGFATIAIKRGYYGDGESALQMECPIAITAGVPA